MKHYYVMFLHSDGRFEGKLSYVSETMLPTEVNLYDFIQALKNGAYIYDYETNVISWQELTDQ